MAFLLDTNVVSELRKPRPNGAVLGRLQSIYATDLHLAPSVHPGGYPFEFAHFVVCRKSSHLCLSIH